MSLRELAEDEFGIWDEFVATSGSGTVFHTTAWLSATGKPYSVFVPRSGAIGGGVVVGERRIAGLRLARGIPLTPYVGLVIEGEGITIAERSQQKQTAADAADFLKRNYDAVALSLSPGVRDVQPFIWEGYDVSVRYTYVADITDVDACWKRMDPTRRRNVRKAEKEGVVVKREDDIDSMLHLVSLTYARQGRTPRFLVYAERLWHRIKAADLGGLFLARDAGARPIAGALITWDGRRGYYLLGGVDPKASSAAGAAVLWHAMRCCAEERGLSEFDFEGSNVPDIERFFRKFGGALVPRFEVRWVRPALRLPLAALRPTSHVRSMLGR